MSLVLESGFLIDAASIAGSAHENQDAWGMRDEIFWVLDGATAPVASNKLTVVDFVRSLNEALYQHADTRRGLREILHRALAAIATHPATRAGFSATVAMAKYTPTGWQWLVLGDAGIVVNDSSSGLRLVSDQRPDHIAGGLRTRRKAAQSNPVAADQFEKLTVALRREEDRWRNVRGGFWVAGAVPDAAVHALEGTVRASTNMYLLTDGVTDGLKSNYWPSTNAAVADWQIHGVETSVGNMQRSLLNRYGVVDDATLMSVRLNA